MESCMRIVVTGSAGFIGKNLVKHLRDQNHDVTEFEYIENSYASNVPADVDRI